FDKSLARHLRSEPTQPSACADAETLAAYHERLLAPHELSSWKGHITGCARCQEILAHLEATDEIPVASVQENEAHVVPMPELPPVVAAVAAAVNPAAEAVSIQSASPSSGKPRRPAWRLLVPAGALAAGLLVWIASRDRMQQNILQPTSPTPVSSVASSPPVG